MDEKKQSLLVSAARLYSLGIDLENARKRLRELADRGAAYDSQEMRDAYRAFIRIEQRWKALEQQYLALREKILRESGRGAQERI